MERLKVDEQSPAVQAAVALENRLTTIEAKLDGLINVTTDLRDRVGTQNGRVSKLENNERELREDIRVQRELVDTPRWARFDSVASQVKSLWEAQVTHDELEDVQLRWWQGNKLRLETVLALLGIAGGGYAVLEKFVGG